MIFFCIHEVDLFNTKKNKKHAPNKVETVFFNITTGLENENLNNECANAEMKIKILTYSSSPNI